MDFNKIKELIKLVETSDITGLVIEEGEARIEIKKQPEQIYTATASVIPRATAQPVATTTPLPLVDVPDNTPAIKSPMTGTFYIKPSPEAPDFVKVGDRVINGQPVCIIEAMKTFNEIESDLDGVIEKILFSSGQLVEAGQPLFLVRQ